MNNTNNTAPALEAITKIRKRFGNEPICCGNPVPGQPGDGWLQPPDPPECCGQPEETVGMLLEVIEAALATAAQPPAPREPLKFSQRKALAICTESQKVSVSEVQRKMQISYAAAQELCQSLVDYGGLVDGFALSPSLKPAHKERT